MIGESDNEFAESELGERPPTPIYRPKLMPLNDEIDTHFLLEGTKIREASSFEMVLDFCNTSLKVVCWPLKPTKEWIEDREEQKRYTLRFSCLTKISSWVPQKDPGFHPSIDEIRHMNETR